MSAALCERCVKTGCYLIPNAVQAAHDIEVGDPVGEGHADRTLRDARKNGCPNETLITEMVETARSKRPVQSATKEKVIMPQGGGCLEHLGIWNSQALGESLGTDPRGMTITRTAQNIAAAKTVIRDRYGMPRLTATIQRPFDIAEDYAESHPEGVLYRLAPAIFGPLGLVAHAFVIVTGNEDLIDQMYVASIHTSTV